MDEGHGGQLVPALMGPGLQAFGAAPDSRGPMVIMLLSFVGIRQVYLYIITRFVANTPFLVGFGYPVGWTSCCILELSYYFLCRRKREMSKGEPWNGF